MKNRKKLILIIFFLIICLILFLFFTNIKKKEKEKIAQIKINDIYTKYSPFIFGNKIEYKDQLAVFFNNELIIHENINLLKVENSITIENLKKLDNLENKINLQKEKAENLNFNDINEVLDNFSNNEKKAIMQIYNKSIINKNKDNDLKMKKNYIEYLNEELKIIDFLNKNKNNYHIANQKIMYQNDEFKKNFRKLNNDIKLEKEISKSVKIPILMYHGVLDKAWGDTTLFVKIQDFEEQMHFLKDNGYTALFLSEINNASEYEKPIIITFDDGYRDVYEYAFPILKKNSLKANFFVITDGINKEVFVTNDMIKEMSNSGIVEIGSHTFSHQVLSGVDEKTQEFELKKSKEDLEKLLGKDITTIAYPYGGYNDTTLKLVKKYYKYAVTTNNGLNYSNKLSNYLFKRNKIDRSMSINQFKTKI